MAAYLYTLRFVDVAAPKALPHVADAVTKPVMLYNVPGRTAVDLVPETVIVPSYAPNPADCAIAGDSTNISANAAAAMNRARV